MELVVVGFCEVVVFVELVDCVGVEDFVLDV